MHSDLRRASPRRISAQVLSPERGSNGRDDGRVPERAPRAPPRDPGRGRARVRRAGARRGPSGSGRLAVPAAGLTLTRFCSRRTLGPPPVPERHIIYHKPHAD